MLGWGHSQCWHDANLAAGGGVSPSYTSKLTNVTYFMNTTGSGLPFTEAQTQCVDNGGHLVAYLSLEEQLEIEKHFTDYGWWLPYYHKAG
jgi:hypothetical protein